MENQTKMKLKICGMKEPQNIRQVAALLPEYMGFIFWPKSPRYFKGTIPEMPATIKKVGVFVDEDLHTVLNIQPRHELDYIQLHGSESPEYCQQLKNENLKIIKAFSISDRFDFDRIAHYETIVDYFLFDAKGYMPGGNGTQFNWEILKNYAADRPFFLSGGIGADDLPAITALNLPVFAIDVNSRFEITAGHKNIALLKAFKNKMS